MRASPPVQVRPSVPKYFHSVELCHFRVHVYYVPAAGDVVTFIERIPRLGISVGRRMRNTAIPSVMLHIEIAVVSEVLKRVFKHGKAVLFQRVMGNLGWR